MRVATPALPLLLAALIGTIPAAAETLRCRVVNGNATCAGSGAVSCQTINGRTTCVSGDGGIVQQFDSRQPPATQPEAIPDDDAADPDEAMPPAPPRRPLRLERRGPGGHWLRIEQSEGRLRVQTDRLLVERN